MKTFNNQVSTSELFLAGLEIVIPSGSRSTDDISTNVGMSKVTAAKSPLLPVVPRGTFKCLETFRKNAQSKLKCLGTAFNGSVVVSSAKVAAYKNVISNIESEFNMLKQHILDNYDGLIAKLYDEEDVATHDILNQLVWSKSQLERRISLKVFPLIKLTGQSQEDNDAIGKIVEQSSFADIAHASSKVYKNSFKGKSKLLARGIPQLHSLSKLVKTRTSTAPGLLNICTTFDQILAGLPKEGSVEGQQFNELTRWVAVLSSEDLLIDHAEDKVRFDVDAFDVFTPVVKAKEAPAPKVVNTTPVVKQPKAKPAPQSMFDF